MRYDNLTIEEFRHKNEQLKDEIATSISEVLKKECGKFNIYPDDIYVTIHSIQTIDGKTAYSVDVDVNYDFWK